MGHADAYVAGGYPLALGATESAARRENYTLQEALDDLVEVGCLDCAPDTVAFYRIKGGHLLRLLGADLPLAQLSMDLLRSYIQVEAITENRGVSIMLSAG